MRRSRSAYIHFGSVLASLLLAARPIACSAQAWIVGPGVVPAPFNASEVGYGGLRIVPDTEIVATTNRIAGSNDWLVGDIAVGLWWFYDAVFEGGWIEGATVTTEPGMLNAAGGTAIVVGGGHPDLEFHDGLYRGGSVIIGSPTADGGNFHGRSALSVSGEIQLVAKIFGGTFEGGTVSMASSPDVILSREPALSLTHHYGGTVDIYGGEFLGGILIRPLYSVTRMTFYGTELSIDPPPLNGRHAVEKAVVSGRYLNGDQFSHDVFIDFSADIPSVTVTQGDGYLSLSHNVPEPAAATLAAAWGMVFAGAARSRQRLGG